MKEKVYIYKITNLINGKVYIGQTNNLKRRWHQYKHASKQSEHCQLITKAIAKYGIDNFKIEKIDEVDSREEANEKEEYYMNLYDSRNLNVGYNIMTGGGVFGVTDYVKDKISKGLLEYYKTHNGTNYGKKFTEKHKLAMSISAIGKPGTNTGKKFTEEHKDKISKSNMYKKHSDETLKKISSFRIGKSPPNKRITNEIIIDVRKNYLSIKEFSKKYNFSETTIRDILYNKIYCDNNYIPPERKIFTFLKNHEIDEIRSSNLSIQELANKFNVKEITIQKIIDYKIYNRKKLDYNLVYDLYYNKQVSKEKIAKQFGCDKRLVCKTLDKNST